MRQDLKIEKAAIDLIKTFRRASSSYIFLSLFNWEFDCKEQDKDLEVWFLWTHPQLFNINIIIDVWELRKAIIKMG